MIIIFITIIYSQYNINQIFAYKKFFYMNKYWYTYLFIYMFLILYNNYYNILYKKKKLFLIYDT